jgi:hypothetical protein
MGSGNSKRPRLEEDMLRQRLAGSYIPSARHEEDAMFAYTIQAEAQALIELLVESDQIISGVSSVH